MESTKWAIPGSRDKSANCVHCPRPNHCASGALFDETPAGSALSSPGPNREPGGPTAALGGAGGFDRPRPYILDPTPRRRGAHALGNTIRLGVTLAGRARAWFPWVVAAMAGIARRGLTVERHPLILARLTAVGPAGAQLEIDPATFGIGAVIPELSGAGIVAEGPPPSPQAIVGLITPADLQQQGRRLDRLDGAAFFRRLIRRTGTLVETYCSPPPEGGACDYRALASLADQVGVEDQNVSTNTWERYSNRLEAKHPLRGLVGQVLFTHIPEPLWPYLVLGQWVHLGKGASFGQGRYCVMPQAEVP